MNYYSGIFLEVSKIHIIMIRVPYINLFQWEKEILSKQIYKMNNIIKENFLYSIYIIKTRKSFQVKRLILFLSCVSID